MKSLTLRTAICCAPLLLLTQTLCAQEETAPVQERYLFELLRAGGWTMLPLGLCLLAALYLLVYCWRETSPKRFFDKNTQAIPAVPGVANTSPVSQSRAEATAAIAATTEEATTATGATLPGTLRGNTLFAAALNRGLAKARGRQPQAAARAAAENAIGETLTHAEAEQLRWIGYLNIIAAIAPMIGLLGTVSGMIGAFGTISLGGMGRPEMLAGNIGEALVSTATGLAVAIPAMLCYHVLHNRLGLRMNETVSLLNDALDERFGQNEDTAHPVTKPLQQIQ